MTTTGYGDIVPTTVLGKLLGSAIMLAGLVILALPITLISTNFAEAYEAGPSAACDLRIPPTLPAPFCPVPAVGRADPACPDVRDRGV